MTDLDTDHGTVIEVTEARQGRRGRHALWILIVSLALVALALWGAWAFRAPDLASVEPSQARETHNAQKFDSPAPQPKQDAPLSQAH